MTLDLLAEWRLSVRELARATLLPIAYPDATDAIAELSRKLAACREAANNVGDEQARDAAVPDLQDAYTDAVDLAAGIIARRPFNQARLMLEANDIIGRVESAEMIRKLPRAARRAPAPAVPTVPEEPPADTSPGWDSLGDAKQAILRALSKLTGRAQGKGVAKQAGYKYGTLRHHFAELRAWGYIDHTKDGYGLTPAGAALVPM